MPTVLMPIRSFENSVILFAVSIPILILVTVVVMLARLRVSPGPLMSAAPLRALAKFTMVSTKLMMLMIIGICIISIVVVVVIRVAVVAITGVIPRATC